MATIYERLKKIVVEQLGVESKEVVPSASFVDDLGADSLDLVELIMSLEEEFDLLETQPPGYIKLLKSGYLSSGSQGSIEPLTFSWGLWGADGIVYGFHSYTQVPPCAFDVFARIDGEEKYLGPAICRPGYSYHPYYNYWPNAPKVTSMDLILRSSEQRARETTDLYEIWDGELIFENVEVRIED